MFSVIIPIYNKQNQLSEAICSVLQQKNPNFELILVDDGSTDNSLAVATSFTDSRVHIIRQKNSGVSVARNSGIQHSYGDYLCFLDADDVWLPNHLTVLEDLIKEYPDVGLYATRYKLIEHDGTEKIVPLKSNTLVTDIFALELETGYSYLHTNSVCIPKKIFGKVGYFVPGEKIGEDSSLWLRIAAYYDIALAEATTTVYRREFSDAFIGLALPSDWSFIKYFDDILFFDAEISRVKKNNISKYINRYHLSMCRHEILLGNRKKAYFYYSQINWKWSGINKKILTVFCFFIPSAVLRSIYYKKNHGSFRKQE